MIFYIVTIICVLFSYFAEKTSKRRYLIAAFLLAGFFVGLRDTSVGIDSISYSNIFYNLQRGVFSSNVERVFQFISYAILHVFGRIEYIFLFFALITNALIFSRLWTLRCECSLAIMVLIYMLLLYPQSANIMRQYVAISIIFFATSCLENNKYIRFIIFVAIATLIHSASFVAIAYIPIYVLFSSDVIKNRRRKFMLLLLFLLPFLCNILLNIYSGYASYLTANGNNQIGLMNIYKLAIIAFYVITNYRRLEKRRFSPLQKDSIKFGAVTVAYSLGVILSFMGYYITTLTRIGLPFILFEIPFIVFTCTHGKNKGYYRLLYVAMISVYFYMNVKSGWSGLANYKLTTFD